MSDTSSPREREFKPDLRTHERKLDLSGSAIRSFDTVA